ncbi:hypothetical protein AB205_0106470 [Aquarana catesbeiana]|uniref:Uncharacterized protein n=1 Tax=Aquarana catesbeiana TaxID=8400 RepID=A0A2G9RZP7_AQUCT|nr:hypothetical protein AB205_0106470 [Aquarana catesbeiana]
MCVCFLCRLNKLLLNIKSELLNAIQTNTQETRKQQFGTLALQFVEEFQKIQQAKDTLTNEESRAHYDYWRRSKIMIPFTQWEALQDSLKMSMHWTVKNKKEAMLEAPNKPSDGAQDDILNDAEEKNNPLSSEHESYILEEPQENFDLLSPKSPEGRPDMTYCLLRFRWSAEAPSDLLRKFRNYEI